MKSNTVARNALVLSIFCFVSLGCAIAIICEFHGEEWSVIPVAFSPFFFEIGLLSLLIFFRQMPTEFYRKGDGVKLSRPRWLEGLKAWLGGYFWAACPNCRKPYGGHEPGSGSMYLGMGSGRSVCCECKKAVESRNDYADLRHP